LENELKTRKKKKRLEAWLKRLPSKLAVQASALQKNKNKTKQKQKTLENKQKNQMSSHPCWLQRPGENSNGKYILFCVICKFIYIDGTLSN
jgi:arsenate reductase-like glutaredoxin family protein